jgi:hypothetical protein
MSRRVGADIQDKDEAVARTINWAPDLDGATISGVTWETSGLTDQSHTNTDTTSSIRLAGGVPGQEYRVTCRVTTSNGETLESFILLTIDD